MPRLTELDWALIALYFLLIFSAAAYAAWRARRDGRQTSSDYFLAGRNSVWFIIGASLFASNIGSEHLVGLAGTGAASGIAVAQFEILAAFILLLLGWFFAPFYLRSGVYTMPEFLEHRYSSAARWYLAVVSIIGYVLTKISVTIFAGGLVFESLMGIDFWTGALVVVVATGIYTIFGGLRAVLITDAVQMVVLLGGAIAVTFMGLNAVGGWREMAATAGPELMTLWKPATDPDFPWTGILLGAPILGIWYWCTDQFIVQRVLAARDLSHARRGTVFAGFLKLLPLFVFVVPGVIAHVLVQQGRLELTASDQALPVLVATLLPAGLRGIVVAGLLAALMSSLSSVFNSTSTLITWDIYRKLRPEASERRLVWVGRIATALLVGCGLLWIPLMGLVSGQLYQYIQSVQAYIAPPIAAVFLLGLLSTRLNATGAMAALILGFVLGMGRLVAELNRGSLPADGWIAAFAGINFLHFAALLFAVCSGMLVLGSLLTPPPPRERVEPLTFRRKRRSPARAAAARLAGPGPAPGPAAGHATGGGIATAPAPVATPRVATPEVAPSAAGSLRLDLLWSLLLMAAVAVVWVYFS